MRKMCAEGVRPQRSERAAGWVLSPEPRRAAAPPVAPRPRPIEVDDGRKAVGVPEPRLQLCEHFEVAGVD